jgi:DNA-binding LacI/PurR family transcriptional regulator
MTAWPTSHDILIMATSPKPPSRRQRSGKAHRPATIETVAERAGVSRQTVSNVLNAPERVLPETRARVQQAIDELHYRPNRLGSALQSRTTRSFAYGCHLSEDEENLLLDRFLHELCRAAALRRHHIVLVSPIDADDELVTYEDMFRTGSVDGIILSGTYPGDRRLDFMREHEIPSVSFGRDWDHPEKGGWVDIDGAAGIDEAVRHFWNSGHRSIAWLGATSGGAESDRREGYRRAMAQLGGSVTELECDDRIEDATDAALGVLGGRSAPTAFVCSTDVAAVGCARAATELHLKLGGELGVIGFDDTRLALATTPQLSSIRQPTDVVARLLIDGLIETVSNHVALAPQMLAPTLIHRGSS